MSEDLLRDYPDVYLPDDGPGPRGLEFKPGWMPLVHEYCDRLRSLKLDVRLRWAKEKFGCLRVSWSNDRTMSDLQRHWLDIGDERVRRKSLTVCHECGQPGHLQIGLFHATLCDQHVHMVGDLRPELTVIRDPERQRLVGGRVARTTGRARHYDLLDAALGLDDDPTWDSKKAFVVRFMPMLYPGVVLSDDDQELAILADKLMQVDAMISLIPEVDFRLHVYRDGETTTTRSAFPTDMTTERSTQRSTTS